MEQKRLRTMPLVVLFKSEGEEPDKFVKVLEDGGFSVRSINCLDFRFKNLDKLKHELNSPDNYEGIIFTSQRAVQGVKKASEMDSEVLNNWVEKSNFCVGESTSEMSQKLLKLKTKGKDTGNAQALASFIVDQYNEMVRPKPFLFPSGNLKQDILEKVLKENEINCETLEIYETIPHEDLEKSIQEMKTLEVVFLVFFSPSGFKFSHKILLKHEVDLEKIKIIAIGPSTKKSVEEAELNCYRVCSKPTPDSLLEALTN